MKNKIIIFLLVLLQFNSLKAEKLQSLNPNINIDDEGAIYYLLSRCSGLYIQVAGLIEKQEPDLSKSYQQIAEDITTTLYVIDMGLNDYSGEEAISSVNNLISKIIEIYGEDMDSNYVNTGSYFSEITRDDLVTCQEFLDRNFNF